MENANTKPKQEGTPKPERDPLSELILLRKIDKKFSEVEAWTNTKVTEMKDDIFQMINDIKINSDKIMG